MEFFKFMFVPTILFLTVVAPIWITMHYRSVNRSSRSLSEEDRETIQQIHENVDNMTQRIIKMEKIRETYHPPWQHKMAREDRGEE
jgi:phage shock protein B